METFWKRVQAGEAACYTRYMPEHERRRPIPHWAERERLGDLAWIAENLPGFWSTARAAYEAEGRGALVVDMTVRPTGGGFPFGYVAQEQIRQFGGQDEVRMVAVYDPSWEMVIVLIKPRDRISSYRVGIPGQQSEPHAR